ncbi:MAG: DUF1990 family protein [Actinobacteria bacterium]|nr:DUF1990 family protein [Actinomycetota bacterium]
MREWLLGPVDEAAALDDLAGRGLNYDPARAPEDGRPEGRWHVDSVAAVIGQEPPGDPVAGGPWERARQLVGQYEFADARILRAVYHDDRPLLGRDMLLEGRFLFLRFYLGVRITGVIDETRQTSAGRERVSGWCYQTLAGHLEQGRLSYEVIKNLGTGQIAFRVTGYSRRSRIPNPLVRWGFRVFGHWMQQRFYRNVQTRMAVLVQKSQSGGVLPSPEIRPDGLVLAPSGVEPHPAERLAVGLLHPGA